MIAGVAHGVRPSEGHMAAHIRRREFMAALGGAAAAWPLAARAQQGGATKRVGLVTSLTEQDPETQARLAAFRQGLERRGWVDGRNVRIDYRFAPVASTDEAQRMANELVASRPDVIFSHGTGNSAALQRATRTVPIVFVSVSDPIGSGFITSLPRPGGNMTGILLYEATITGKWLAVLKEIAPSLARAAVLGNPKTIPYDYYLRAAQSAASTLAIELMPTRVETVADIEQAIESFAKSPNGGLLVLPGTTSITSRSLIIALAARHRLPAVYTGRVFVTDGGLMSYDTDLVDVFRQGAAYVDRILRGDKPADLPVQAPVRYETVLNLRTARALGLAVPPGLLIAADEVIE
jgi:putative tryptophan/tyrosine transport system substrate-binding protein